MIDVRQKIYATENDHFVVVDIIAKSFSNILDT